MSGYTPGPWIATPDPHGTADDYCIGVAGGKIDQVAVCSERDARLIAAAPELAEALKGILEAAPDFASHIAAIDKARAALDVAIDEARAGNGGDG